MKTPARTCALFFLCLCGAGRLLAGGAPAPSKPDTGPVLQVITSGQARSVSRADLNTTLRPAALTVYNPIYKRRMTYEGFWLEQALGALHVKLADQDIVFLSADGYGTSLSVAEVGREKWLMAYGEPGGWTPLPNHTPPELPGPWYVVAADSATFKEFPWPYRVVTVKIRRNW